MGSFDAKDQAAGSVSILVTNFAPMMRAPQKSFAFMPAQSARIATGQRGQHIGVPPSPQA
jgi:hypothetical protein